MESIELYLQAAEESARIAYEWAMDAKRTARNIDPLASSIVTIALNFLITLSLITLMR